MSATMHTCYKCGSILPPGSERCPNCGSPAPLSDEEIAATSSRVFRGSDVAPIPSQHLSTPARGVAADTEAVPTVPIGASASPADNVHYNPVPPPAPEPQNLFPHSGIVSSAESRPQRNTPDARPERRAVNRPDRPTEGGGWSSRVVLSIALAVLLLIGAGTAIALFVGGDDAEVTATFYPVEDITLSENADGSGATVVTVPFGESVGMITPGPERSLVLYRRNGVEARGYAETYMLLDSASRAILAAAVRGQALRALPHGYQRRALIEYFRTLGGGEGRWRLEVPALDVYRETYTDRIVNPDSRYEDVAVVITNGMDHRLVLFSFDAAGNSRLVGSRPVTGSKIHSVRLDPSAPGGIDADVREY